MIVDGPKTAQLMPMSMGPRFSSPDEGIISFLSIPTGTAELPRLCVQQPSLGTRRGGRLWSGSNDKDGGYTT